ncbi:hypothetical protein CAEBREN_24458 [Caenorhabditis brenneri]|uniref:Chromo domain-containing protein n=1 Tax=Caenorhabditis brenneri TaxID=135651 RepID=G0NE34_CAEBE|nr:hypothetical protein CAEBREN_24458 [Caenorhabditis brenneri]
MPKKARKRCTKIINKVKFYTVEAILDKRTNGEGEEEYEIKWVGYDETSWEPNSSLTLCQDALDQFEKDYASRRQVSSGYPQLASTSPSGFPQPEFTPPPGSRQPRPSPPSGFSRSVRNRMKVFLPCKNRLRCQVQKRKNYFIKAHLKRTAKKPKSLPSTIFHKADTVFPTDKLKKIHTMFVGRVGGKTRIAHFLCIMEDKEQLIYKSEIVKKHWPEILAKFYLRHVQFHGSQLLYP